MFSATRRSIAQSLLRVPCQIRASSARFSTHQRSFSPAPRSPLSPPNLGPFLSTLTSVLRFGAFAYVVQVYVCNTTLSVGPSMQPTLNPRGDVLFTEYISPRLSLLGAGDVVVATKPTDPRVSVVKRVRGMPGDHIWVHPIDKATPLLYTVPPGHVWLEGDNRHQSTDSRHYGPVPLALIRGRARCRVWPLTQAALLSSVVIDHTEATRRATPVAEEKSNRATSSTETSSSAAPADGVR